MHAKSAIRQLFGELDPFGRFWLGLGLVSLAAAAAMSFAFGYEISLKHALFLAILSVVAAFGPMASEQLWSMGRRSVALATAAICVPLLAIEFYSHAGYTAGLRGSNIETTRVANVRYDVTHDALRDERANVSMWRDHLAKLTAEHTWATTVTADGLRAELATAQKAIDIETARGGCKTKCLALMQQKAALEKRIAVAEKVNDLTKQIEATQRIIDSKTKAATQIEHKSSPVDHQNKFLTRVVALGFNGSTTASDLQSAATEESVNLAMALAGTGLPAFALFMAGLFRRRRDDDPHATMPVRTVPDTSLALAIKRACSPQTA